MKHHLNHKHQMLIAALSWLFIGHLLWFAHASHTTTHAHASPLSAPTEFYLLAQPRSQLRDQQSDPDTHKAQHTPCPPPLGLALYLILIVFAEQKSARPWRPLIAPLFYHLQYRFIHSRRTITIN